MSDIFQEVEQDMRRERLKRVWDKYGVFVIVAAVLIVLITAGWRGYDAWNTSRERAAGDAFIAALEQAGELETASAAQGLLDFAQSAPAGYAMLAEFRAGTALAQAGETTQAREVFEGLADNGGIEPVYRDLARLRLAQLQVDTGEFDAARQTIAAMAEDTANPFTKSAQELMGLAAYAADDMDEAHRWFKDLVDVAGTPPAVQRRARFMLDLIKQTTGIGSQSATAPAAAAAEETN